MLISLQMHLFFCTAFSKFLSTPYVSIVLVSSLILYLDFTFLFLSSYYIIPNTPCPVRHDLLTCFWNQSGQENFHSSFWKWGHITGTWLNILENFFCHFLPLILHLYCWVSGKNKRQPFLTLGYLDDQHIFRYESEEQGQSPGVWVETFQTFVLRSGPDRGLKEKEKDFRVILSDIMVQ